MYPLRALLLCQVSPAGFERLRAGVPCLVLALSVFAVALAPGRSAFPGALLDVDGLVLFVAVLTFFSNVSIFFVLSKLFVT